MKILAMILAGGISPGLSILTRYRAEPAIPFGGKYRVIDFTLSNCVNSDIYNVAVLTQYMPRSLNEHIHSGKPWDLDRASGGVRMLQPYQSSAEESGAWQEGSVDAIRFNLDAVRESEADVVLILSGNHIYKMNYQPMLEYHMQRQADVTVAVRAVSPHMTHRFGMVTMDTDGRITKFDEKPRRTRSDLASMGVYLFDAKLLIHWLTGPAKDCRHMGLDVLPRLVKRKRVFGYVYEGYWSDIGTVPAYYEANMALLADIPALDLTDMRWVIHTQSEQYPPVWYGPNADVQASLLSDGARIEGTVLRSVIGPGVYVAKEAVVQDSIIMNDSVLDHGAVIHKAIIDKDVSIGAGARVGVGDDNTPNSSLPDVLNTGITLVGKRALVPAAVTLGRNVVISADTDEGAYADQLVASGSTL